MTGVRTPVPLAAAMTGLALLFCAPANGATATFAFTGAEQTFVVPADVHSVHIVAVGAPGGASGSGASRGAGGKGAVMSGDAAVSPGQVLFVEVGGKGKEQIAPVSQAGGFNGGGAGGFGPGTGGGGGGGASDVRSASGSLTSRLVVAAGGGGASGLTAGGDAGANGNGSKGGKAGTSSAGGASGGTGIGGGKSATAGSLGTGGDGADGDNYGGGGGGAGYYGGGGGGGGTGADSGGGGGSSFSVSGGSPTLDASGTPSVTITYTPSPPGATPIALVAAVGKETISPGAFPAAPSGPSAVATRRRRKYGAKVTYTLNVAARVAFRVQKRKRVRCKRSRKRKCKRLVTLRGGFTLNGKAGTNKFRFRGRLRRRKLKPGRYFLVATPTAGGVKGKSARARFRIVK